jgi:hypothetical protein
MKIADVRPGLQVVHAKYGIGDVKVITEKTVEILFNEGRKTLSSEDLDVLQSVDPTVTLEGLHRPLRELIAEIVDVTTERLNLQVDHEPIDSQLGQRWPGGKLVLHPRDPALATKEVEIEVFFRKIVSIRDNLRVLEQKINTHPKLTDSDRIDLQAYITKSYGSLTTFNLLFKDKEGQF